MKRTVSIKLNIDPSTYLPLMEQCSHIFNAHVDWAFENNSYNKSKAHHDLYDSLRKQFPEVPSALLQTQRDTALEAIKASRLKKRPRKKATSSIRYDKRTMTLRGNQLTFSCLGKRQKHILNIPDYFKDVVKSWNFKGGTICYQHKLFFAKLCFEKENPQETQNTEVLGIDRGLYHFAVLSNGKKISGQKVRKQQRKYLYNRKKLQAKGTPSAKRKLKKISGKEKRFSQDFNHCVSKEIANLPYKVFVLEDLSGIRKQKKGKKLNKWLSSWTYYQFESFLKYKAEDRGKVVEKVDARYTSQKCSSCGKIHKESRKKSKYYCIECGFRDHADLNAAKNIRNNYLLSTHKINESERQVAVNQPKVTTNLV